MQNVFQVHRNGESLVARLVENGGRTIELTYTNPNGDSQVGIYKNGIEISMRAMRSDERALILDFEGNTSLFAYRTVYDKLGPELRAQIPSDWHAVLGRWLAPEE